VLSWSRFSRWSCALDGVVDEAPTIAIKADEISFVSRYGLGLTDMAEDDRADGVVEEAPTIAITEDCIVICEPIWFGTDRCA